MAGTGIAKWGWRRRPSIEADGMTTRPAAYLRHSRPTEFISHSVWVYHVFSLSLREVALILAERSGIGTHEKIRHWS